MLHLSARCVCAMLTTLPIVTVASNVAGFAVYKQSQPAEAVLLAERFAEQRVERRDVDTLGQTQEHSFAGSADDLTRFLKEAAALRRTDVTVYFTGPQGVLELEPLTPEAAQTAADYDWQVQVQHRDTLVVVIPLASRIPFSEIIVSSNLSVEAYDSGPRAARRYAELRDRRRHALKTP